MTLVTSRSFMAENLKNALNQEHHLSVTLIPVYEVQPYATVQDSVHGKTIGSWSESGDVSFYSKWDSIDIYKEERKIDTVQSDDWLSFSSGQIYEILTFTNLGRTYFVFGGTMCGSGACTDSNQPYSIDTSGTINKSVEIWSHNWGWGHGGAPASGFQGDEKLDFVLASKDTLYLFPNSSAQVIVVGPDGKMLDKVEQANISNYIKSH